MGQIQSSIGLVTGVPITDTVDQLIAFSAQPRDRLAGRTALLKQEQVAITELTALVIGIQFAADALGKSEVFDDKKVTSSNSDLLSTTITGTPVPGSYEFTPVRRAKSHQLLSNGIAASDQALGAGTLTFRQGGFVDRSVSLADLNGGGGVQRGRIRITDRAGDSAVVDLRFAQTVDDVVNAINSTDAIDVQAVVDGDQLKLVDQTGQTTSNLRVREFGLGSTAADLGLDGIDVAANEATGQDILSVHDNLSLSQLNDGNGISLRDGLPDLNITFRDNSAALDIEFSAESTLGELVATINAADPARISAAISADGDRLELTDLTSGSGTFAVSSPLGGELAEDLGLTGTAVAGVLTGNRLLGGLNTSLVRSLAGGQGLQLGQLDLTDRAGGSASVDLSAAETLDDVITAINASGANITASINQARNGIQLTDNSGGAGNLIVANGDATNSADALGLAVNAAQSSVDGGSLDLQVVSEQTELATFNNGAGVDDGSFLITDGNGQTGAVNISQLEAENVGDILDAINGLGIGVSARINDTGDGILLVDTVGGGITVEDSGNGTTAADLGIAGTSSEVDLQGTPTHVLDGATTIRVEIEADDTLDDLIEKINALDAGVTASIFNDGSSSQPFRLALTSNRTGSAGELLVDGSGASLGFQEISAAKDALLLIGDADSLGAGILASSDNNVFSSVLAGVSVTVQAPSETPVTIDVKTSDESLASKVKLFVDQYNKLRSKLDELTFFSETDSSTGILFGSSETLRVESGLANVLTSRFFGVGKVQSLGELGLSFKDDGQLELDSEKLKGRYAADPDAVEQFFTSEELGFATKVHDVIETLAGENNSLLINRGESLQRKIESNDERIEFLTSRLGTERELLLKKFFQLESIVGRLRSSLNVVNAIQGIPPLVSTR